MAYCPPASATGCSPSFEDSCVLVAKALHSSNRSALMRMTGSDEGRGSQSKNDACVYYIAWFCYISLRQLRPS
jgi:hypothetical protein